MESCAAGVACGRMTQLHELWGLETAPGETAVVGSRESPSHLPMSHGPQYPSAFTYEPQHQGDPEHDTANSFTLLIMGSHRSYSNQSLPMREPTSPSAQHRPPGARSHGNPFSSKVNGVLSTSYADSEFREVLSMVDERGLTNSPEVRRQIRLQIQKEVIDSNGEIIREFGHVADVSFVIVPANIGYLFPRWLAVIIWSRGW